MEKSKILYYRKSQTNNASHKNVPSLVARILSSIVLGVYNCTSVCLTDKPIVATLGQVPCFLNSCKGWSKYSSWMRNCRCALGRHSKLIEVQPLQPDWLLHRLNKHSSFFLSIPYYFTGKACFFLLFSSSLPLFFFFVIFVFTLLPVFLLFIVSFLSFFLSF